MFFPFIASALASAVLSGNISGPHGVTFVTPPGSVLYLTGSNHYTGATRIQGIVSISSSENLPETPVILGIGSEKGVLQIEGDVILPQALQAVSPHSGIEVDQNCTAVLQGDLTAVYPLNINGAGNVVLKTSSIPIPLDVTGNLQIE